MSGAALRIKAFPSALNRLGVGVGTAGILSLVPAMSGLEVVFGFLQIVWFFWLGIVMLRGSRSATAERPDAPVPRHETMSLSASRPDKDKGRTLE